MPILFSQIHSNLFLTNISHKLHTSIYSVHLNPPENRRTMAPAHGLRDISNFAARLAVEARSSGADGTDVQNPGLIAGVVLGGVAFAALVFALLLCRKR